MASARFGFSSWTPTAGKILKRYFPTKPVSAPSLVPPFFHPTDSSPPLLCLLLGYCCSHVGSRQYIIHSGRFIYTQRLKGANVNDKIILNKVLLVGTKTTAYIGKPVVPNAAVHAVVEEQLLDDKVIVFKYKRKKNYLRNMLG
ncbi:hypothetical protein NE237_022984 [Protea cynaroides]|uniref:Ribosomal protein L21 n=1 Tax=Protea cynaroides TaxID=273540 RepID=A0A9Q0HC13_9MAGN|nr:hypothetical protein NE237_022984 [Protea cynaroides]